MPRDEAKRLVDACRPMFPRVGETASYGRGFDPPFNFVLVFKEGRERQIRGRPTARPAFRNGQAAGNTLCEPAGAVPTSFKISVRFDGAAVGGTVLGEGFDHAEHLVAVALVACKCHALGQGSATRASRVKTCLKVQSGRPTESLVLPR